MEKVHTNRNVSSTKGSNASLEEKGTLQHQNLNGDELPPQLEQILSDFHSQRNIGNTKNILKRENSTNSASNKLNNVRSSPRTPKKNRKRTVHYEDYDDEEEEYFGGFSLTPKTRFRSNHFNIRPSTPTSRFMQPKRVLTPDWDKYAPKIQKRSTSDDLEKYLDDDDDENDNEKIWRDLNLIERHRRLEIYEDRIIWGLNKDYQHPAQAIDAARDGMTFVISKEEADKAERYEEVKCQHIVPKFWEPRIWDKKEDALDEQKSEQLEDSIQEASNPKPSRPSTPHSHSSKRQSVKRSLSANVSKKKGVNYLQVMLPIGSYATDNEDDNSEWDDLL